MVSKLLTFITGRPNPWIIESTHGLKQAIKQDDQSFISIQTTRDPLGQIKSKFWISVSSPALNIINLNYLNNVP